MPKPEAVETPDNQGQQQVMDDPINDPIYKKDPKVEQDNLTPEHPRFKEIYAKYKEAETKLGTTEKMLDTLAQHNKTLDARLTELAQQRTQEPPSQSPAKSETNFEEEIRVRKSEMRKLLRVDPEERDYDRIWQLEDEVNSLNNQNLISTISSKIPDPTKIIQQSRQQEVTESNENAGKEFIENNAWMQPGSSEYNENMQAAAWGLDALLMRKFPDPVKRYAEIKKRVETQFNYKGAGIDPPDNLNVEGGNGPVSKPDAIKLSPEEEELANRFYSDDPGWKERLIKQKRYLASLR